MDVGVDADRRNSKTEAKDEVCSFAPNPGQSEQSGFVRRYLTAVLVAQNPTDRVQLTGFGVVKTGGVDCLCNAVDVDLCEPLRIGRDRNESPACLSRYVILCPQGDHARDQKSKR